MTKEILNMSKEELINAIIDIDEHGKSLEVSLKSLIDDRNELYKEMVDGHNELQSQIDEMDSSIEYAIGIMKLSAETIAEMRKVLKDKYSCHVM